MRLKQDSLYLFRVKAGPHRREFGTSGLGVNSSSRATFRHNRVLPEEASTNNSAGLPPNAPPYFVAG